MNLDQQIGVLDCSKLFVGIALNDPEEVRVLSFFSDEMGTDFSKINTSAKNIDLEIPNFNLRAGVYDLTYQISVGSTSPNDFVDVLEKAVEIEVLPGDFWNTGKLNRRGNYSLLYSQFRNDV